MHSKLRISLLIVGVLLALQMSASGVTSLHEIMKPEAFTINKDRLYIAQQYSIYTYSRKDLSFIKKFGRAGEGPGEFVTIIGVYAGDDYCAVTRTGAISLFTVDGEFIRQVHGGTYSSRFLPIGNKFVGGHYSTEKNTKYESINLLNEHLKPEKELYRWKSSYQDTGDLNIVAEEPTFFVNGDLVIFNDMDGLINFYDINGHKIRSINPRIKRVKSSPEDKDRYLEYLKNKNRTTKMLYEMNKNRIEYPEINPYLRSFQVAGKKLYLVTYKRKGDQYLCHVLDFNGKKLKESYLPVKYDEYMVDAMPYQIWDDKVYQLIENDDEECWDLHVTPF